MATKAPTRGPAVKRVSKPAVGPAGKGPLSKKPRFHVNVQFVRTADDDGAQPSSLTREGAEAALAKLNEIWSRNGGDVRFHLHPASNFDELIRSTLLNQDCTYTAGWDAAKVEQQTDPSLDPETMCETKSHDIARNAYGMARGNRVIVFSRGGREYLAFDSEAGNWIIKKASGGASSNASFHIRMPPSFAGSTLLAHEMGHYLHAAHTFGHQPKTIDEARTLMEAFVDKYPDREPAEAFDYDATVKYSVHDTPPDPSHTLFKTVHGNHCDLAKATVTIPGVAVGRTKHNVVLAPDRRNIMSYFKGCDFDHYLSNGQWVRIHEALETGNRQELVTPVAATCYEAGFMPGPPIDTPEKLAALMRKIATCVLLSKKPMPWELVEQDIYVNPADKRAKGVRTIGKVGVNVRKERAFIDEMLAPMTQ